MGEAIFKRRKYVIASIFMGFGLLILLQLFRVQVLNDDYKAQADNKYLREISTFPARGLILDRNGKVIVENQAVYDLMVVPRDVKDVNVTDFCVLFQITEEEYTARLQKAKKYSPHLASLFVTQITAETYARAQEYLYKFTGFYPVVRTIRKYPYKNAPHLFGYLGEVNQKNIEKDAYYRSGDFVGKTGLERFYEEELRGQKGQKFITVDVLNREQGSYKGGTDDKAAMMGRNLQLGMDIDLQLYGEQLMQNKRGSVVAIEPATGEILAMVSSPFYDPNLLSGSQRGKNYQILLKDTLKPLINRPVSAIYPPGSTLKPMVALIALEEEVVKPSFYYNCPGYYQLTSSRRLHCSHNHEICRNVGIAIKESCNPYFWTLFSKTIENKRYESSADALDKWVDYFHSFHLGLPLEVDLNSESLGRMPSRALYDRIYGKHRWAASTIISLGIGQGEFALTPLQMAHLTAAIAQRGQYHLPHLVRSIEGEAPEKLDLSIHKSLISDEHFTAVLDGMQATIEDGTGRIAQIEGIEVCGKTGTVQIAKGEDHSMFICFAPRENPKIAIAVVVENGGYGSRYAAPIAGLMVEKYLKGEIAKDKKYLEKRMFDADLLGTSMPKETAENTTE